MSPCPFAEVVPWTLPTPRETAAEVAARLLAGAGAATLAVDVADERHLLPALHTSIGGATGVLAPPVTAPAAGRIAMLSVDETAHLVTVPCHIAGLVSAGRLRPACGVEATAITRRLDPQTIWEDALPYVFVPDRIELVGPFVAGVLPAWTAEAVRPDPVAMRSPEIVEAIRLHLGDALNDLCADALGAAGHDVRVLDAAPLTADRHGVTAVCSTPVARYEVRVTFPETVVDPLGALSALRRARDMCAAPPEPA